MVGEKKIYSKFNYLDEICFVLFRPGALSEGAEVVLQLGGS